jgi:probable HAF family extracellular repeat protein
MPIRAVALAALAAATTAAAAPLYRVVPIARSASPRIQWIKATRINDAGVVAGLCGAMDGTGTAVEYPVLWSPGGAPRIDRLHWGYVPTSINAAGAVLAYTPGNPGADQTLSAVWLDGHAASSWPVDTVQGNDLNDGFVATGGEDWFDPARGVGVHTAVVFDRERHVTPLPTLGGVRADGYAINAQGDVVGQSTIAGESQARAFLYRAGATIDLQAGADSVAWGVNGAGLVVGLRRSGSDWQVFTWRDGQLTGVGLPFAVPGGPVVVNDAGTIAWSGLASGGGAFVASGGAVHDINRSLTPDSAGWRVVEVDDINAAGVLVAQALDADGVPRSVELVPQ